MLDVLIVGGGPHALTLATLLSHPDQAHQALCSPHTHTLLQGLQLSQARAKTTRAKTTRASGRRAPAGQPAADRSTPEEGAERLPCPPLDLRVVDSYGGWAALWESQLTALNIPHLRSHTLVHTDPLNKRALQEFVLEQGRGAELHSLPEHAFILDDHTFFNDQRMGKKDRRRLSSAIGLQRALYFSLPGTALSIDFFRQQVQRYDLDGVLLRGMVDQITPVPGPDGTVRFFRVLLQGGATVDARRVVMATGPTRAQMANIPGWVSAIAERYPDDRLQHTVSLMHHLTHARRQEAGSQTQEEEESPASSGAYVVCEAGQRVMVIGGGLTSAHIISLALQQGAGHVTWVLRKHLQLKQFDVGDVESLVGRYAHVEHGIKLDGRAYLRQFYSESSLHKRLAMVRQARKGGAVTPEAYAALQPFIQTGRITIKSYCQVSEARWCYRTQAWGLSLGSGEAWAGDRIWLATGCKLDVNQDPLLSSVMTDFPIQVLDGWPCIGESLQWAPGCPLYLMGQYTALQVGPHAVNLAGGQAASMRIAKDILRHHRGDADRRDTERTGDADRRDTERTRDADRRDTERTQTRTEEYVQQMHGLMWL